MKPESGLRILWLLNILLIPIVGWFVSHTLRESTGTIKQIERKLVDLERLAEVELSRGGNKAYVESFEQLPKPRSTPLRVLLAEISPGLTADIQPEEDRLTGTDWSVRRVKVEIKDMALEELGRFLMNAELQRPPWRLEDCSIVATPNRQGRGRVTLVMEALEKDAPTEQISGLR